jgi:hypothetical protein
MKNYDYIFILMCIFVLRITVLSGSYADVLCLIGILAYHLGNKIIEKNKITNEALIKIESNHELTQSQIKIIAEEVNKAKVAAEGVKAAINFNKR